MTTRENLAETVHGDGEEVIVTDDGETVALRYVQHNNGPGLEMARFSTDGTVLSVFPYSTSATDFGPQFHQVRELQIAAPYWAWDGGSPIGESDRDSSLQLLGLPKGFGKNFRYGLGIRREYRGLIREIEEKTACTVVRFGTPEIEGAKGNIFHLAMDRFSNYVGAVGLHRGRGDTVVRRVNESVAQNEIADITGDAKLPPVLGRLSQIQAMTRAVSDNAPLDIGEQTELLTKVDAAAKTIAKEQPSSFGKLREDLQLVTLEVLIENFERQLGTGKGGSEDQWQQFFVDNTFALKQIFASPVALYGEQLLVRMPDMKNTGGQIVDFVLANTLTLSMVVVEIKTPATKLISKSAYRGQSSAKVHAPTSGLSGAVAQLQSQIESARSNFDQIVRQNPGTIPIDARIVTGAVIAGRLR